MRMREVPGHVPVRSQSASGLQPSTKKVSAQPENLSVIW